MATASPRQKALALGCGLLLLCAAAALALSAGAAGAAPLQAKLETARSEAASLAADLSESRQRQLDAEARAGAAAEREEELSSLLAVGERRAAALTRRVAASQRRLEAERARLHRARRLLAERLVAIYESGTPDAYSVVLGSSDYGEIAARAEYLRAIEESDSALAARVAAVRDVVKRALKRVAAAERRARAYNERLRAARAEIAAVRAEAESGAAELAAIAAERSAALAELRTDIDRWVAQVQAARRAAAEAASAAAAEEEVGRWLGGPYSIPTYIVMCESGGNYSALNPSSGAGGAYQIIPSTWEAYGGKGLPHEAPKAEQDRIAAEIWADSGGSAWVCA